MEEKLIALDKNPRSLTVRLGETWRRLMAKYVMHIASKKAKDACGIEQLTGGVESGIERGVHTMRLVKYHDLQKDY